MVTRNQSLERLEGKVWAAPSTNATEIIVRCHALRKIPLAELTAADIRILLNQGIGIDYLMPIAMKIIDDDPIIEADYYPGDLLCAALRIEPSYWLKNLELKQKLAEAVINAIRLLSASEEDKQSNSQLLKELELFIK